MRPVTLQRVLVIGIEPTLLHQAERLDQPPAVGDGIWSVGKASGGGARNCPLIVLADRMRRVRAAARRAAGGRVSARPREWSRARRD